MKIIERGQAKDMTFEEVYTQYQPLIRKMANKWDGMEDSKQIAEIELWRAYQLYNPLTLVSFTHFAESVIHKRFQRLYRDTQLYKRKGELFEYDDTMENRTKDNDLDLRTDIKTIINNFPEELIKIVSYTYSGYSQQEIAREFNTSQAYVSRRMKKIKKQLIAIC